jgi:hypothetical protein
MKFRSGNKGESDRAVALVITLIMLAMVTVMTIIFLALARRERASVKLAEDIAAAQMASFTGLERAKNEAVAQMAAGGSKLNYDLFVSTNFMRKGGFDPSVKNFDSNNVGYVYQNGQPVIKDDYMRMLGNLQFDPRPPVFVPTDDNGGLEFRYYLDFNRNRQFETNGFLPAYNTNGTALNPDPRTWFKFVGDPEWIGILERPGLPHSETNRFVARFAYLALPAGKTLDLNFIHNQAMEGASDNIKDAPARNGFIRNQGYGSWEINLAAFLRELNTNVWLPASYANYNPLANGSYPRGASFDDARALLSFRYANRTWLDNPENALSPVPPAAGAAFKIQNEFANDSIDNFGDGPIFFVDRVKDDDDVTKVQWQHWPGSLNTNLSQANGYSDVQQLFTAGDPQFNYSNPFVDFTTRLKNATTRSKSSYDRYTLYNMLGQMGVDSAPAIKGRLHLNYENAVGYVTNSYQPWTNAVRFFTNAADLMFHASAEVKTFTANNAVVTNLFIGETRVRTNFSVTNILFYSLPITNLPARTVPPISTEYTADTRRILQLAANIYDNMTNIGAQYPYFPTVFRPVWTKSRTNIIVSGFVEVPDATFLGNNTWLSAKDWLTTPQTGVFTNINLYGQPVIIGTKKGHPNFNELSMDNYLEVARKVELGKTAAGGPVTSTNQMFLVNLSSRWGMEGWHSYTNNYRYRLRVHADIESTITLTNVITNLTGIPVYTLVYSNVISTVTNLTVNPWPGWNLYNTNFKVFIDETFPLITNQPFSSTKNTFFPSEPPAFSTIDSGPRFILSTTNRVRFWMFEERSKKLVDCLTMDDLRGIMNMTNALYQPTTATAAVPSSSGNKGFGGSGTANATGNINPDLLWDPTPTNTINKGIDYQLKISDGEIPVARTVWRSYQHSQEKEAGIAAFAAFEGLISTNPPPSDLRHQAPFVPSRVLHRVFSWQVNDPLVHYIASDLQSPVLNGYSNIEKLQPGYNGTQWNIGTNNVLYRPWGLGGPGIAFNPGLKDPGVHKSDDWRFPIGTNNYFRFANIGFLGRVHRGTPWQTVYLKSMFAHHAGTNVYIPEPSVWPSWSGSLGTYPSQDHKILDVFTTAPNENAARGLLSINQAHRAAWSAVLSGVPVISNSLPERVVLTNRNAILEPNAFTPLFIEPATPQIASIVDSINAYRTNQLQMVQGRNPASPNPTVIGPYFQTNQFAHGVFERLGDILGAPGLTYESPYVNLASTNQLHNGMIDEAVERLPQEILSLLQKDEPRFVVYSFGQSLKPAPRSLSTSAEFYNICTNYQITGEVITKTTFRVEGDLRNPNDPLRTVVEDYRVLPPPE